MFIDYSVGDVSTVHGRYKVTNNWGWAAWQFLLGFPFWRSSFTQPQEAAALAGFDGQPHLWPGTFGRSPGLTEVGSIWQCAPWRRFDGGWLVDWHSLVFSILLSWQLCNYVYQGVKYVGTVNFSEHMMELGIEGSCRWYHLICVRCMACQH